MDNDKRNIRIRRWVAVLALTAALLIGGTLDWAITSAKRPAQEATNAQVALRFAPATPPAANGRVSLEAGFASMLEPLLPAVVNISSSKTVRRTQGQGQNPFEDDPFFRQFFGNPFGDQGGQGPGQGQGRQGQQGPEQKEHSLGSGMIISPDGYILTNNHVVDGATDIEVSLSDKRQLKAKVIGTDPRTDIAVLKIQATGLASVVIGDSSKSKVGDIVLAIGDPFGIGETVTMGIVSATGRSGLAIEGPEGYEDFIQTDAAINPGNSGGPLVNVRGELIGINTAIISGEGGGNQGVGFAVPVNMARNVLEQILKNGKVTRGYLGVMIQEVTPGLATAFNLPSASGALVGDVTADSPGAKAGLKKGDVIVGINGETIPDYNALRLRISQLPPGQAVKLDVYRDGKKIEISATLAEFPEQAANNQSSNEGANDSMDGVQVEALTPDITQQLNLPATVRGVVVTNVDPNSDAAESGLTRGDVIQEINHTAITSVAQFNTAVRAAGSDKPLLLLVNTHGNTHYILMQPSK